MNTTDLICTCLSLIAVAQLVRLMVADWIDAQ